METIKNCEVVEVNQDQDVVLFQLLDKEKLEVHTIKWNKKAYDAEHKKFVESEEKEKQVEEWANQYFNLNLEEIEKAIGQVKDVYAYDTFDSLWECVQKIPPELEGQILSATIKAITLEKEGIRIDFDYEGDVYRSNMSFTDKIGDTYYINPQKRKKAVEKFEEKFHVPVEESDKLIGKQIMVEIKKAFGKFIYADIKKLPPVRKK